MFIEHRITKYPKPQRGDMYHLPEAPIKLMTQAARLGSLSHSQQAIPLLRRGLIETYL